MKPTVGVIACLGWGSLVWDPRELPSSGGWHHDEPMLPIEFGRESGAMKNQRGNKMSLVICPGSARVRAYWTVLDVPDMGTARICLAKREGIPKNWQTDIGFADLLNDHARGIEADTITSWAAHMGLAGVVWTNLSHKFNNEHVLPSETEVITFLRSLDDTNREVAEHYVRNTPTQIDNIYRRAIEKEMGWLRCD